MQEIEQSSDATFDAMNLQMYQYLSALSFEFV